MNNQYSLSRLGWSHFFQQQLSLEEWQALTPARIVGQERSLLHLLGSDGKQSLRVTPSMPAMTVGDWICVDSEGRFHRLLDRSSLFSRRAAGTRVTTQLIASNIDTVFVVCSMNMDFSLNRIERYLSLANESAVEPVIVLTRVDCCDHPEDYVEQAQSLDPLLEIVTVNSLDSDSVGQLESWCVSGKTIALLGSSGVGKSTLINTLLGEEIQRTNAIRDDDEKGRHTTTGRSLHPLKAGGLLLDTPGMRELQIADCEQGVEQTFSEIAELSAQCKFTDCGHQSEPGCAVRTAIDNGTLDERRLTSYLKLMREQAFNKASLAEKRARDREFGRYVRTVMDSKRKQKNDR